MKTTILMKLLVVSCVIIFFAERSYSQSVISWPTDKMTMKLTWESSTDDFSHQDSLSYDILDSLNIIGTTKDTSFHIFRPDSGLYHFGVQAIDEAGNRSVPTYLDSLIYVSYIDTIPPSPPQNLKREFLDNGFGAVGFDVEFEWTGDFDNFLLHYTADTTIGYGSIGLGDMKEFTIVMPDTVFVRIAKIINDTTYTSKWKKTGADQ